jgi:hypothetical protein
MRIRDFYAAAMVLVAVPALAQSPKEVTGPWTLNSDIVTCIDLPILTIPIPRLVVKGPQDGDARFAMVTGDQLVIGRSADDGLAVGNRYVASRLSRNAQYFPRQGEGYGGLRVTVFVTVTAVNQWNALARIDLACDAIQDGDYLDPFVANDLPKEAAPVLYPDFTERASVLFGSDDRHLVGQGDVVSIDRGTAHGVTPGARYAVYRDKHNGLPLIHLGELVVLTVNETTSKVMVTHASAGIERGDTVVPRRLKEPQQ